MRQTFVNTIENMAIRNKDVMLLTADLGFSIYENFVKNTPDQFLNVGIAEQNMTGIAAGMAMEGKIPFMYSIIPFVTMRNFEQIRNDLCYQNLNVKIVGVGAGFTYGPYGHTHHGLEDIGILRTLANLTIFCPGDAKETKFATEEAFKIKGPVYIRLGRTGEPLIHEGEPKLKVGKGAVVMDGTDITIFATSTMVYRALEAAKLLMKKGKSVRVVSMHTIKPFDTEIIVDCAKNTKAIFSLEEHSIIGGLGSTVAEVLAESNVKIIFKRIGVPDRFTEVIGNQEYMRKANHLAPEQITLIILQHLRNE